MSDYNKKYAKEKYKRVFTDIQKNVAQTFEQNLKKLGYSRSLIFKTAIELFNNEDEYFLEKLQTKQEEKEMTLAQLINKMKEEHKDRKESGCVYSEHFTFIDETDLYEISISCDGEILYTDFKYELDEENNEYSIFRTEAQPPMEVDIYSNRNRKIKKLNVKF